MGTDRLHARFLSGWRRLRARRRLRHPERDARLAALRTLAALGVPLDADTARPLLHDPEPTVRAEALRTVRALATEAEAWTGHARFATRDLDARVRQIALESLTGRREASSAAAILDLWDDPDETLRTAAVEATLRIPRDVLPWLDHARRATSHARSVTRCSALAILGRAGEARDLRLLWFRFADEDASTRRVALRAALTLDALATHDLLAASVDHPLTTWRRLARSHAAERGTLDVRTIVDAWGSSDAEERALAIEHAGTARSRLRREALRVIRSGDASARTAAIAWLARHDSPEDASALEAPFASADPPVRAALVAAALRLAPGAAREAWIARGLGDEAAVVRGATCRAIVELGGGPAQAVVRERLAAEADPEARLPAFLARLACAEDVAERRALAVERLDAHPAPPPELLRAALLELRLSGRPEDHARIASFLAHADAAVREAAILVLPSCGASRDLWEATVRAAATDARWERRLAAAQLLRAHGFARDLPLVEALLGDEDPDVRAAALQAGAALAGSQRAWHALVVRGLRDEHWNVRRLALEHLGRGGLAADLELVLPFWSDEDREVADAALAAAVALGPNRHELLAHARRALTSERHAVRERALAFLARHGDESDLTFARARLASPEDEERAEALGLLVELAPVASTWRPEVVARLTEDPGWAVRARAATILGSDGEPEDVRLLANAALDPDEDVRAAAVGAVERLAPRVPDTADLVEDLCVLARLADEGLRARGVWVLAWFSDRRALAEMLSATGDVDPGVADRAERLLAGDAGPLPLRRDRPDGASLPEAHRRALREGCAWIEEQARALGAADARAVSAGGESPRAGARAAPLELVVPDLVLALDPERGPAVHRAVGLEALVTAQCRAAGVVAPGSSAEGVLRTLLAVKAERALERRGAAFQFAFRSLRRFLEDASERRLSAGERRRFFGESGRGPAGSLALRDLVDLPGLLDAVATFALCLRLERAAPPDHPAAAALAALPDGFARFGLERSARLAEELAEILERSATSPPLPPDFPRRRLLARLAMTGWLPGLELETAPGIRRRPPPAEDDADEAAAARERCALRRAAAHLRAGWIQRARREETPNLELLVHVACPDAFRTPWPRFFLESTRRAPGVRGVLLDDVGQATFLGVGHGVPPRVRPTHLDPTRAREHLAASAARDRWHVVLEPLGVSGKRRGVRLVARALRSAGAHERRRPLEARAPVELFRDVARTLLTWLAEPCAAESRRAEERQVEP